MASVTVKNKGGRRPELLFINQSLKVLPTPGAFALKNSKGKEKAQERSFYLTEKKELISPNYTCTVKPVLSGHLSKSRKALRLFTVNLTAIKKTEKKITPDLRLPLNGHVY